MDELRVKLHFEASHLSVTLRVEKTQRHSLKYNSSYLKRTKQTNAKVIIIPSKGKEDKCNRCTHTIYESLAVP